MCSKTYCFRFVLQNRAKAKFTFYIFMRAKEAVDGNRVVEDEREGEIKGTFLGEKEKKGKDGEVRMEVA